MIPRIELAPSYSIARVLTGGWQLSAGHRPGSEIEPTESVNALVRLAEAGFTTFDCADIYTGVEELFGRFLKAWGSRSEIQIHTKFVPDRSALPALDRRYVERIIDRSLLRLGVERLDLVQYYWWDDAVPGLVETAGFLDDLRRAGKIRLVGVTNFGTDQLGRIVDAGIEIAAHQVQYSLLDRRPERGMVDFCARHGIHLLCYGSLAGGFLSERWRHQKRPTFEAGALTNRSLVKYSLIIEEFGGWSLYQELLEAAAHVAARHGVSIANVAARYTLERSRVAGVIIGARSAAHLESNRRIFGWPFNDVDERRLAAVQERATGPLGDIFGLEKVPRGRHATIMKTDLNRLQG